MEVIVQRLLKSSNPNFLTTQVLGSPETLQLPSASLTFAD
jgi:hypothetical protein